MVYKTKTNKTETQHNMCWTPQYATKHESAIYWKKIVRRMGLPVALYPCTKSRVMWLCVSVDELVDRDGFTVADVRLSNPESFIFGGCCNLLSIKLCQVVNDWCKILRVYDTTQRNVKRFFYNFFYVIGNHLNLTFVFKVFFLWCNTTNSLKQEA